MGKFPGGGKSSTTPVYLDIEGTVIDVECSDGSMYVLMGNLHK